MKKKTLVQEIVSAVTAEKNCIKNNNSQWALRWDMMLEKIERDLLPSGSGIDAGTKVDRERTNPQNLVLTSSFHKMDDNGYYCGWVDFEVHVTANLLTGFDIEIKMDFPSEEERTCKCRTEEEIEQEEECTCDVDDYYYEGLVECLADTFHHVLNQEVYYKAL